MRWIGRHQPMSVGAISWEIINRHISYLISPSLDAGWHGQSNAGKICDMLETGIQPDFQGGGNSNAKMIREVEKLTFPDSRYDYLFSDLSDIQKLCLCVAVLADGRKNEHGKSPSNAAIVAMLPAYAAQLRFKVPHKPIKVNRFEKHVSEGKSLFVKRVEKELIKRGI